MTFEHSLASTNGLIHIYDMMQDLERAKAYCEQVIDNLPFCFAIIDQHGVIFRSNHEIAQHFSKTMETLLGESLSGLFSHDSWLEFQKHQGMLDASTDRSRSISFNLKITTSKVRDESFVWVLRPFGSNFGEGRYLYQVIALGGFQRPS